MCGQAAEVPRGLTQPERGYFPPTTSNLTRRLTVWATGEVGGGWRQRSGRERGGKEGEGVEYVKRKKGKGTLGVHAWGGIGNGEGGRRMRTE